MTSRGADLTETLAFRFACVTLVWGPLAQGSTFGWGFAGLILLGCITSATALLSLGLRGRVYVSNPLWAVMSLAFIVWIWLSTMWAPDLHAALRWASGWTAILGVAFTVHIFATTPQRINVLVAIFILTTACVIGLALMQLLEIPILDFETLHGVPNEFLTGPYYHPSHLSGYLISSASVCSTVLFFTRFGWHTLPILVLSLGIQVINLQTNGSSTPIVIVAALVPAVVSILKQCSEFGKILCISGGISSLIVFPTVSFIKELDIFQKIQSILGIQQDLMMFLKIRIAVHRFAIEMWYNHPIIGVGIGQWVTEYHKYRLPVDHDPVRKYVDGMFVNYAHNDYLQILAETGIVGLVLFLGVLLSSFGGGSRFNLLKLCWLFVLPMYGFTGLYDGHLTVIQGTAIIVFTLAASPQVTVEATN